MTESRSTLIGLGLGLALVAPQHAGAQLPGSGALAARSTVRVKGCGGISQALGLIAVARSDGTWDAEDTLGTGWSGTHVPRGSSGRKLDLQFDAPSMSRFVAAVADDAAALCEQPVTVSSAVRKKFLLRVNRRGTVAKLAIVYVFTGSAGGRPGSATYRLKGTGTWTAGVPTAVRYGHRASLAELPGIVSATWL